MLIVTIGLLGSTLHAQNDWPGVYEFEEDGGQTAGGSPIYIIHTITVTVSDGKWRARIQSQGYQTSIDVFARVIAKKKTISLYFDSYGEDNVMREFEENSHLLTLKKKNDRLLTYWGEFGPIIESNKKDGKVRFKLAKTDKDETGPKPQAPSTEAEPETESGN